MGLFDQALIYGGVFYRHYSQAYGSNDLEKYFSDAPVANGGLCAACSFDWIRYYLTRTSDALYDNAHLSANSSEILTIQKTLRVRDQSLSSLLKDCGMEPLIGGYNNTNFGYADCVDAAYQTAFINSVNVISYLIPNHGRHVAVFYVDENKQLYFSDTQKGDVTIPAPASLNWLVEYFKIFTRQCGEITISSFSTSWNEEKAGKVLRSLYTEALRYDPGLFRIKPRPRSVDDINFENRPIVKNNFKVTLSP